MRVAAIQHDIAWEDAATTRARVAPMIAGVVATGARLVVLPEMFATGFSMRTEVTAESPDGPTTSFLVDRAAEHGVWLAATVATQDAAAARPVNRFVLAGPSGQLHDYVKVHTFTYAGESDHFDRGETVNTFVIEGVRVTPLVCFDLRFADLFWEAAAATDLYVVPANWPSARRHHWQTLLRARAIENQAYVMGVNRVGDDGTGLSHAGDSAVVDPMGEVLASAAGEEAILVTEIDPARVTEVRERFPFQADRRPH